MVQNRNFFENMSEECWYKDGLHFSCTGCGKCCCGAPGYVWVSIEEIERISYFLKISLDLMIRTYIRKVDNRYSLIELKKSNYACPFLQDGRCTIYPVRPTQCKTFPWWEQNLSSPEAFYDVAFLCEGICKEAPLVSFETIQQNLTQKD